MDLNQCQWCGIRCASGHNIWAAIVVHIHLFNDIVIGVILQEDINTFGVWAMTWGRRFQPFKYNMSQLCRKTISAVHIFFRGASSQEYVLYKIHSEKI